MREHATARAAGKRAPDRRISCVIYDGSLAPGDTIRVLRRDPAGPELFRSGHRRDHGDSCALRRQVSGRCRRNAHPGGGTATSRMKSAGGHELRGACQTNVQASFNRCANASEAHRAWADRAGAGFVGLVTNAKTPARIHELRHRFGFDIRTSSVAPIDDDGFLHPRCALYELAGKPKGVL